MRLTRRCVRVCFEFDVSVFMSLFTAQQMNPFELGNSRDDCVRKIVRQTKSGKWTNEWIDKSWNYSLRLGIVIMHWARAIEVAAEQVANLEY